MMMMMVIRVLRWRTGGQADMQFSLARRGVDPYGTGGDTSPQYLDWGDITNAPNISRVISATFYPCNILLIS